MCWRYENRIFRVLSHSQTCLFWEFNSNFLTSIPVPFIWNYPRAKIQCIWASCENGGYCTARIYTLSKNIIKATIYIEHVSSKKMKLSRRIETIANCTDDHIKHCIVSYEKRLDPARWMCSVHFRRCCQYVVRIKITRMKEATDSLFQCFQLFPLFFKFKHVKYITHTAIISAPQYGTKMIYSDV